MYIFLEISVKLLPPHIHPYYILDGLGHTYGPPFTYHVMSWTGKHLETIHEEI